MFKKIIKYMAKIFINGITYTGNTVSIVDSRIIIDGVNVTPEAKIINIKVEGDIQQLNGGISDIVVDGNVGELKTSVGNVTVSGSVTGNVTTSTGNVKVGGSIRGSVKTSIGNINSNESRI
jgi:hypothetical protein